MPFITEETLARGLRRQPAGEVDRADALSARTIGTTCDNEAQLEMELAARHSIVEIRALRKEIGVEEKADRLPSSFASTAAFASTVVEEQSATIVERLARVSEVRFVDQNLGGLVQAFDAATFDVAVIYERTIDVPAERERLTKDIAKYEKGLAAAERQLGNEGFLAKAPAHMVEGLKKQEAETRLLLEKAQAALAALPKAEAISFANELTTDY